jgi:hypothetical protein
MTTTAQVFLASYTGTRPGAHGLVNRGIRFADKSIYSHTEIAVLHVDQEASPGGIVLSNFDCYSSSGSDHGVRKKTMPLNPAKWDLVWLPWMTATPVLDLYQDTQGAPYDFMGTGRFAIPLLLREHPVRWFCCEWAAACMGLQDPWRFTPAGVRAVALAMGGKPVPKLTHTPT